jgi:hypothetical protein
LQAGGVEGFFNPLAASPDPLQESLCWQHFLRESRYKLCADPPHTRPLRSPGKNWLKTEPMEDYQLGEKRGADLTQPIGLPKNVEE